MTVDGEGEKECRRRVASEMRKQSISELLNGATTSEDGARCASLL